MPKSRQPQVIQNEVAARRLAGESKLQIARKVGISRNCVSRILQWSNLEQWLKDAREKYAQEVIPDAIESVHAQIVDRKARGDGALAQRALESAWKIGDDDADRQQIVVNIAFDTMTSSARRAESQHSMTQQSESSVAQHAADDSCGRSNRTSQPDTSERQPSSSIPRGYINCPSCGGLHPTPPCGPFRNL